MHPAFSVIFLTTLIGAGQGLFLALFTGQLYHSLGVINTPIPRNFFLMGSVIVAVLLGLGLFSSFFHLGRPERAWRAASQWRTSWLSREVIILPTFTAVALLWGGLHYLQIDPVLFQPSVNFSITLTLLVGAIATVLCFLLFLCTAMIYAAVKFIQEWATPLTVANFVLLGGASGFTLAAGLAAWQGNDLIPFYVGWAIVITLIGLIVRVISLVRNARLKPKSTPETAIGVRHPQIRQTSQGAMGGSFNTREFFHHRSDAAVRMVKWFFLIMAFAVPLAMLLTGTAASNATLLMVAAAIQFIGLVAERWFFFVQANHPQNIYYQAT